MTPHCDMKKTCSALVTHIGDKGYIYCARHAITRREGGHERCRKMRVWELKLIEQGKPLPRYEPKPVPACVASMGCLCAGHARGIGASELCDTTELSGLTPGGSCRLLRAERLASGLNEVNAAAPVGVPSDDHDLLLSQTPGNFPRGGLRSGKVPGASAPGGDYLDDEGRLAGTLPDAPRSKLRHAGEALGDGAGDRSLDHLRIVRDAGPSRKSGADVEPRGADRGKRSKAGHSESLPQARKRLEKRAGRDPRVHWILIDASSGEVEIETSWLPEGLLTWKRKKNGHYVARIKLVELAWALEMIGKVLREENGGQK